ncbi:MAG: hypothetical protein Q9207_002213 [Kuettlingeria erythrocarpa]
MKDHPVQGNPTEGSFPGNLPVTPITPTTLPGVSRMTSTTPPPHPSPYILRRKGPATVTETVSITISVFAVSYAVETQLLTLTDTVYINKTVFQPVYRTAHVTHTLTFNQTIPTTIISTATLPPSAALGQGTLRPVPAHQESRLGSIAIAGIAVGAILGLGLLMAAGWFAMRKYRAWKAKKNQHMRGVELQRSWEREQEVRKMEDVEVGA